MTKLPERNIEWTEVIKLLKDCEPGEYSIKDCGNLYILCRAGTPDALVFWGGQDALEAQRWLASISLD